MADPVKARAISAESTAYLRDLGFSDQEIGQVADHRMMLVVRDALAFRKSQKAAKTAAGKKVVGVPRVQKPGGGSDAKADTAPAPATTAPAAAVPTSAMPAAAPPSGGSFGLGMHRHPATWTKT